ncbi:MAG: tyrosine--tRNA ligase [Oscillospiraceae bacterium]|nr:tyrosine--tRNA ligase [Oscillospiraceae bacterium]
MDLIKEFKERELLAQCTNLEVLDKLLKTEKLTFYIGFDATASSLHIGHFMQFKTIRYFQEAGHRAIVIFGGGTTMVGDPTDKTDMRPMLTKEEIEGYIENFKIQADKYIPGAIYINNADWLCEIKYIDMLREIGVHFSVNRMLTAESVKSRLERGLSFLEFNYMIMQGYDFYKLYKSHGCTLQCGGDDQWSNMLAGADLIRRKEQKEAHVLTFALLPDSAGVKMGKTSGNAVWLDPDLTSPYDFYQHWRNTDDSLIIKYLKMMTYVPVAEIDALETGFTDAKNINAAKDRLAYEVTKMIHGESEALKAQNAAKSLFYGGASDENMPVTQISGDGLNLIIEGKTAVVDLLVFGSLAKSKREARQLIEQGGVLLGEEKLTDINHMVTEEQLKSGVIIKKGKKAFMKFIKSGV